MADLKPCPFCGKQMRIQYSSENVRFEIYHDGLRNCAFMRFNIYVPAAENLKEAIELWNRRADDGTD